MLTAELLAHVDQGRIIVAGIPGTGIRRTIGTVLVDDAGAFVQGVAINEAAVVGWIERPAGSATYRLTRAGRAQLAKEVRDRG